MKMVSDNTAHPVWSGTLILFLVGTLMLGGCSSIQHESVTPPPLKDAGPEVQVNDVDVLAVSPAMEKFLERYVLIYGSPQTRLEMLTTAVSRAGALGFEYNETQTRNSSEAFKARAGNCVAFSNLMIALARRAGLVAHYQEVFLSPEWSEFADGTVLLVKHVNVVIETREMSWVVDVSGIKIKQTNRRRLVDDAIVDRVDVRLACRAVQGHRGRQRLRGAGGAAARRFRSGQSPGT